MTPERIASLSDGLDLQAPANSSVAPSRAARNARFIQLSFPVRVAPRGLLRLSMVANHQRIATSTTPPHCLICNQPLVSRAVLARGHLYFGEHKSTIRQCSGGLSIHKHEPRERAF